MERRTATQHVAAPARPLALREVPLAERPRERLHLRGAAGLTAAELVALVWGSGSRGMNAVDLAETALARLDGVSGLARATADELQEVPGVGPARAAQLEAAFELGRRLLVAAPHERTVIKSPADAANLLMLEMGSLEQEHLRTVILDTKNHVLKVHTVYVGSLNTAVVRVGELFKEAIRLNAAAIICCHNHPSQDPTPSAEDVYVTRQIVEAGKLLSIDVLDHLVICLSRWVSLKERGLGF